MIQQSRLFTGTKAIPLNALPEEAWTIVAGEGMPDDAYKLYRRVPWLYRGIQFRANAVSRMPFDIMRGETEVTERDEWAGVVEQMRAILYRTEAGACLYGQAYLLPEMNRFGRNLELRWLLPRTITPQYSQAEGLIGFKRRVSGGNGSILEQHFDVEELVYYWLPALDKEVGPGIPPAVVALAAAGVVANLQDFLASYFGRGAIKATLLTVEGMPSAAERERLKDWWGRFVSGVRNAWRGEVVSAAVKPVIVGEGVAELENEKLTASQREEIATALGIPQTKLFSNAANYATAERDDLGFYNETVIPACESIGETLNAQLFAPLGVKLVFRPEKLEQFQASELEKAEKVMILVGAPVLTLNEGRELLGYAPMTEAPAAIPGADEVAQESEDERGEEMRTFRRWIKKRDGATDVDEFESAYLSRDEKLVIKADVWPVKAALEAEGMLEERASLESKHTEALSGAFAVWLGKVVPRNASTEVARAAAARVLETSGPMRESLVRMLLDAALMGVEEGREQVERQVFGTKRAPLGGIDWELANEAARLWALGNPEQVGAGYVDDLLDAMAATTRRQVAAEVANWIDNSEPLSALIDRLATGPFDPRRAELVAVTEVTRAFAEGNRLAWKESGVILRREWRASADERVCPICGPLHGTQAGLDTPFEAEGNVRDNPPAHPRCRCWIVPVAD